MGKRYYLGVDGGGTKTACVLYDALTGRLWGVQSGPTNHETLSGGMGELPRALEKAFRPLLDKAGLGCQDIAAAAFGLAGVDTERQRETIFDMIARLGFGNFVLVNDAYLAVKGVCGSAGIGAVNGTGCNVVGINVRGQMQQVGGFSSFSGDRGGSAYLVGHVVRSVYEQHFKGGKSTAMSGMLFAFLGIQDETGMMETLMYRLEQSRSETTLALCRMAYTAAAAGDSVAKEILRGIGWDYARSIRALAARLDLTAPVPVGLVGSQFTKCEDSTVIETLKGELGPDYDVRIIDTKPVAGALFWALELEGLKTDREALKKQIAAILHL